MKLSLTNVLSLLAVIAMIVVGALYFNVKPAQASGQYSTNIGLVATTSAAFSVTTSTRVLATTTNPLDPTNSYTRVYATICTNATNPVAINMDGDKTANLVGGKVTAWIAAAAGYQSCYEVTDRNQYSGSITASSTNQTATVVTVKDYVN